MAVDKSIITVLQQFADHFNDFIATNYTARAQYWNMTVKVVRFKTFISSLCPRRCFEELWA